MANEQRGEIELKLGDETYTLRPTFEALCAIEGRLGAGVLEIAERMAARRIGFREVAAIIFETAKAGGHKLDEAKVGEAILEVGLLAVVAPILGLLRRALSGPTVGNAPAPPIEPSG